MGIKKELGKQIKRLRIVNVYTQKSAELLNIIKNNIPKIDNNTEKLEIIYNLTKSSSRK